MKTMRRELAATFHRNPENFTRKLKIINKIEQRDWKPLKNETKQECPQSLNNILDNNTSPHRLPTI